MERNLIYNKQLKEKLANVALNILEQGEHYNELAYTTVEFGYLFDIEGHGLECLFKIITDVDTFYFAVQGEKLKFLNLSEELFQSTTETFLQLHPAEPEEL